MLFLLIIQCQPKTAFVVIMAEQASFAYAMPLIVTQLLVSVL